ncbi:MAG: formimidoylglutamate deiminase [Propionicimonas sp.]
MSLSTRSGPTSGSGSVHPAFANCHSHAFHRALRGRGDGGRTFWGWRDAMYGVAEVLDPDLYHRLARATFAEMALAGIGAVGEFHYLHHDRGGTPYADPHAMAEAVISAAREVGLRICLLDACYLRTGFEDEQLSPTQRRFVHPDAESWAEGVGELEARYTDDPAVVIGTAIHSVRAVDEASLATVASALPGAPLHVHVSEQPAENRACLAATGRTPVQLLADAGVWTSRTTAVHATHLSAADITILGAGGGYACFCPTTEAELADGIGPSVALRDAGVRITLGSDANTVIDMFAEARGLAMHERLVSGTRQGWSSGQLWQAATTDGASSLGFGGLGGFELDPSVRTAGMTEPLWAASAADVRPPPDLDPDWVRTELAVAIAEVWSRL